MPNRKSTTGSELFIVDNSDTDWKVLRYLHDWCQVAKGLDIGVISPHAKLLFEWLRKRRNDIVHNYHYEPTAAALESFFWHPIHQTLDGLPATLFEMILDIYGDQNQALHRNFFGTEPESDFVERLVLTDYPGRIMVFVPLCNEDVVELKTPLDAD